MPKTRNGRRWIASALALLLTAQPPSAPRADEREAAPHLSDWWLEQPTLPAPEMRAYYLRHEDDASQRRLARRLQAELTTLIGRLPVQQGHATRNGLEAWRATIAAELDRGSRTAARADLSSLLAAPRHDPTLARLSEIGVCHAPDWIEIWTLDDVTRHSWRPGLDMATALAELGPRQRGAAQTAWLITPGAAPRRLGIAAWNADETDLVPGSRLVLALNDTSEAAAWINRRLPRFLDGRLPGTSCRSLGPDAPRPQPNLQP